MIHVPKATRAELEVEVLKNDNLCAYLGGLDEVQKMTLDELRDKITEWIIDGDETGSGHE